MQRREGRHIDVSAKLRNLLAQNFGVRQALDTTRDIAEHDYADFWARPHPAGPD